jgi:hypothetical protein
MSVEAICWALNLGERARTSSGTAPRPTQPRKDAGACRADREEPGLGLAQGGADEPAQDRRPQLRQVACAVAGGQSFAGNARCTPGLLQVRQRADPALTPAKPVRVVAKYVLDRASDSSDGVAGARPR